MASAGLSRLTARQGLPDLRAQGDAEPLLPVASRAVDVLRTALARSRASCRLPRADGLPSRAASAEKSEEETEEAPTFWVALNLWLGRCHLALDLAGGVSSDTQAAVALLLERFDGVDLTFPGGRGLAAKLPNGRGKDGRLYIVDGTYPADLGGFARIGYRAYLSRDRSHVATPLIIHFHGANELAAGFTPEAPRTVGFAMLPAHVIFVDYRGTGWSEGGGLGSTSAIDEGGDPAIDGCFQVRGPRLSTLLSDAEALVSALPSIAAACELPWPHPGGVVVMGSSLGSLPAVHLAALYGHLVPLKALVLESAIGCHWPWSEALRSAEACSLVDTVIEGGFPRLEPLDMDPSELLGSRFGCTCCGEADLRALGQADAALVRRSATLFDAVDKIALYDGPVLLVHARRDPICTWPQAEALRAAAAGPVRLVGLDSNGHGDLGVGEECVTYWSELQRFLLDLSAGAHGGVAAVAESARAGLVRAEAQAFYESVD